MEIPLKLGDTDFNLSVAITKDGAAYDWTGRTAVARFKPTSGDDLTTVLVGGVITDPLGPVQVPVLAITNRLITYEFELQAFDGDQLLMTFPRANSDWKVTVEPLRT